MKHDPFKSLVCFDRESQLRKKWGLNAGAIMPLQRTWTRYMLDIWGSKYRGEEAPEGGKINILGRLMVRREWNDHEAERIITVIENLSLQGYSGKELLIRAKEIVMPNNSGAAAITLAKEADDAEIVEKAMTEVFTPDNPLRAVIIKRYCDRKSAQQISIQLSDDTGVHLEVSRIRIRWAENAAERVLFSAISKQMENEISQIAA
ncbi:Uncharacterised protein [Serratia ficaria]|uniref:hypothetical protein n=1 Tax=Serratia ficaria TaxID=61651 RepID=UPI002184102A|nr:hypothetical protein [Serratia ficaria]CAI2002614.1 Uncharacterised protein [Serratia ficaria]CAI2490840.1 Uncharacterised protein [Serratia ficaria]